MSQLLPFFIVLFAGLFFSHIFNRLHLPWVVALLLAGLIIGPDGLDLFRPSDTLTFIGEIGLVFLMFMAGLETRFDSFKKSRGRIASIAFINGLIPALVGFSLGIAFGYEINTAILLGIIFISSSIAVVIPSLESSDMLHKQFGRVVIAATMIQDITSLVLLSILFQKINPVTTLPLPLFYAFLFASLIILRWLLPKLRWVFRKRGGKERDIFQQELRSVFVILIGTVLLFEFLGLHQVIAGFFAGFVLSDSIQSEIFKEKLKTISYGIFIPVFFVIVGTRADLSLILEVKAAAVLIGAIVAGSFFSKLISGWFAARLFGYSTRESALLGVTSTPQLSTTLAVAFTAQQFGLFDNLLTSAIITLTIVSSFVAPLLISYMSRRVHAEAV